LEAYNFFFFFDPSFPITFPSELTLFLTQVFFFFFFSFFVFPVQVTARSGPACFLFSCTFGFSSLRAPLFLSGGRQVFVVPSCLLSSSLFLHRHRSGGAFFHFPSFLLSLFHHQLETLQGFFLVVSHCVFLLCVFSSSQLKVWARVVFPPPTLIICTLPFPPSFTPETYQEPSSQFFSPV